LIDPIDAPNLVQDNNIEFCSPNELQLKELPALERFGLLKQTQTNGVLSKNAETQGKGPEPAPTESLDDIWELSKDLPSIKDDIKYLTWQNFHNQSHHEPHPNFLSEAGPSVFDAALHTYGSALTSVQKSGRALQSGILLKSLMQLGLGRSSVLFSYNLERDKFERAIDDGRASGTTLSTSKSLIDDFMRVGNAQAQLRRYAQKIYSSKSSQAGAVALAKAISTVQDAVEVYLVEKADSIRTLVQLQVAYEAPKMLILFLIDLIDLVHSIKGEEALVSVIYDKLQQLESTNMSDIATQIMRIASRPWLDKLQSICGLSDIPLTVSDGNSRIGEAASDNGNTLNTRKLDFPTFVRQDDSTKVAETSEALRYLIENNPSHSLLKTRRIEVEQLEWAFGWKDIDRISAKASAYQDCLLETLSQASNDKVVVKSASFTNSTVLSPMDTNSDNPWLTLEDPESFFASIKALNKSPTYSARAQPFDLHHAVTSALSHSEDPNPDPLRPPLSLSFHLSIRPFLDIQHHHLTKAALESVMHQHSLRTHLNLLHTFQLCSSGIFTTRLGSALFDPNAELAERKKNTLRSGGSNMGLKLGSGERREWPPASSELRLALMGILTDCWQVSSNHTSTELVSSSTTMSPPSSAPQTFSHAASPTAILPGDLSFALRTDLSASEIDRILNADSLYALDFLRLHYTSPPALRIIFTPSTLELYDRVFRLLLRLLRVNFLLEQLFRDVVIAERGKRKSKKQQAKSDMVQRFRHRASFVVQTVTSQFVFAGIAQPWQRLTQYLNGVDAFLVNDGVDVKHGRLTFAGLAKEHENAIESIASELLVKNKQAKAAVVLEVVLSDILEFSSIVRRKDGDDGQRDNEDMKRYHERFNDHVRGLVTACDEVLQKSGKHGMFEPGQQDAEECLQELVERLGEKQ